jgi:hypothetical protein
MYKFLRVLNGAFAELQRRLSAFSTLSVYQLLCRSFCLCAFHLSVRMEQFDPHWTDFLDN